MTTQDAPAGSVLGSLRYGQALFNDAWAVAPDLVRGIQGGPDNCFYDDARVGDFLAALLSSARKEGAAAEREQIVRLLESTAADKESDPDPSLDPARRSQAIRLCRGIAATIRAIR